MTAKGKWMSANKYIISVCYQMGDLPSRTVPYSEAFAKVDITCGCYRREAKTLFSQRYNMYPRQKAVSFPLALYVLPNDLHEHSCGCFARGSRYFASNSDHEVKTSTNVKS